MPRAKRGAQRGNSHQISRGGDRTRSNLETSFVPFAGTSSHRVGRNGFTLQEEARNTERHQSFWDSDQRLRHTKVNFISARSLEKPESKDPESALARMSLDPPAKEVFEVEVEVQEDDGVEEPKITNSSHDELKTLPFSSFVGMHRGEAINKGLPPPRVRSPSLTPSNSSEEVILFGGRNNQGHGLSRNFKLSKSSTKPIDAKLMLVGEKILEKKELLEDVLYRKEDSSSNWALESAATSSAGFEHILPQRVNKSRYQGRYGRKKAEEEASISDYLANIDKEDDNLQMDYSFPNRELGGTEDEAAWQDETEISSGETRLISQMRPQGGWDYSNICDFDDLSTSDGMMGEIEKIFSKRERKNVLQYLVVGEDQAMDEARWVPATTLTSFGARSCIEKFESEQRIFVQLTRNDEDDSFDSEDIDIKDAEAQEHAYLQRKIGRIDDEQLARLLVKQEELGLGSNELLLFDDAADADEEEEPTVPKTKLSPFMLAFKKTRARRPRREFSDATDLANAYDGFDVMDFDRPSLKKKFKSRKGKLSFDDVSDSELEASRQIAWDNDRVKKKERKQEREQLRAQGLLGSKNGKPDLKQKYKEGMGIQAVKDEIKNFLMGGNSTLHLPPMDKADRKIVHEIANAFNLKSKSAGNGTKRFPVLYRTPKTSTYVERTFAAVEARLTRRFLPRIDISGSRSGAIKRANRGAGGSHNAAVSYRDGDIVGGSAPELGVENRGRAMLEKMGWSSGTALGALNNKGILQPVSHIVKTTKAGLG